jgi:hypothetical protein
MYFDPMLKSIAEKLRAEQEQQRALARRDSSSSIQSLTSAEVEEITRTARSANQRIEAFARDSTTNVPLTPDGATTVKNFLNIPTGLPEFVFLFVLRCAMNERLLRNTFALYVDRVCRLWCELRRTTGSHVYLHRVAVV